MEAIKVEKSKLEGIVNLSGAKNSVLKLLTATILTSEKIIINNFPVGLSDARIHIEMLELLGKTCSIKGSVVTIEQSTKCISELKWENRSIRNTLLILGALVTKTGFGMVPLPGGCKLGDRNYDLHELVLRKLGARVWTERGYLFAEASKKLVGTDIRLDIRSTGATENAIITGCLAKGITRVWNPHIRPEIHDLIKFLNLLGAKIRVFGQEHIEIIGVECLGGVNYSVMPDNMEAITWLIASVITNGDIEIKRFPTKDLEVPMIHLRESGAKFYKGDNSLIVRGGRCYPIDISTGPFPGINSDVQPILAAYAACANGESNIIDLRFPGRYGYANEMSKMGLSYEIKKKLLKINGNGGHLKGAAVKALDLRAGAALALCGLVADGDTIINDAWQIDRGYDDFIHKLKQLNGKVEILK